MFHIAFLSPHSDPEARIGEVDSGGQCVYEYQLGKHLSQIEGVQVTIYCRKKFDYPYISHVNDRFSIKRIVCGGEGFIPKEEMAPVVDEFAERVADDLRRDHVDIVAGHYWDGGAASLFLYKHLVSEFPLVWTPHSLGRAKRARFLGIDNEMIYKFIPRISWESYTLLLSDRIIVSTIDEKQHLMKDYQVEESKITVIPIGIETEFLEPIDRTAARDALNLPQDKVIIMSLGRMDRRKGYHNCIRVFDEFRKTSKIDAIFVLFSGNNASYTTEESLYQGELQALVTELGLQDRVIFRNAVPHEEVRNLYSASDVYLCLSETEPFGITVLEGMYAKIPVIATSDGGPRNIISNNTNGILVDPHDYGRAAYDLQSILKDQKYRKKIILNARRHIEKHYTWKARAEEFYQAYIDLVRHSNKLSKRDFLRHIGVIPFTN
jgi:glycosyltransferase involved in cell wall biosynthesis